MRSSMHTLIRNRSNRFDFPVQALTGQENRALHLYRLDVSTEAYVGVGGTEITEGAQGVMPYFATFDPHVM